MTKEFDRWSTNGAFEGTASNVVLKEALKDQVEMLAMFVFVCTGNGDIINVPEGEAETTEYLVHKSLECLSCTSQAKGLSKEFI